MDHIAAAVAAAASTSPWTTILFITLYMLAGKATAKSCAGGHYCPATKECCTAGCCLTKLSPAPPAAAAAAEGHLLALLSAHAWYIWWAVLALACSCLAAGCLWRRRRRRRSWCFCCCFLGTGSGTAGDASSDASSLGGRLAGLTGTHGHGGSSSSSLTGGGPGAPNAGVYTPPHHLQRHRRLARYARCAAHPLPPPYTEVASKPDLYPLVISYDEQGAKAGAIPPGANYLMVQYFRNCLVRGAVGSLSATSTLDSLSSSFLCNAANEANTMVPPTYSCAASLDEFRVGTPASIATAATGPGGGSVGVNVGGGGAPATVTRSISSIGSFDPSSMTAPPIPSTPVSTPAPTRPTLTTTPTGTSGTTPPTGSTGGPRNVVVSSSATGSEVSSLAGVGTPGSPPRATSPTLELRELLDKIQLLPQREESRHPPLPMRRSNQSGSTRPPPPPRRKPLLYMPLDGATPSTRSKLTSRYYGWPSALSKSAPATPCSPMPLPPAPIPQANNRRPSDSAVIDDGSPLLNPDAASSEEENENNVLEQEEDDL